MPFLFQRFPKTTFLSLTVANSLVGGPTLTSLRTVANNSLHSVSPPFGSVGLVAEAYWPTLSPPFGGQISSQHLLGKN